MSGEKSPRDAVAGLLTLIITTSPTPSAPSTDLLSAIVQGFRRHCPDLLSCRVIVIFDAYDRIVPQARLKKGHVTAEGAAAYVHYKTNLKELILREFHDGGAQQSPHHSDLVEGQGEAEYGSPFIKENAVPFKTSGTADKAVIFVEPERRLGFGLAVREALRLTETPYVWVNQHDWMLVLDIPIRSILEVMQVADSDEVVPVKYVCLPSVRSLVYSASDNVLPFPELRKLTAALKRDFSPPSEPESKIPLTPMFFWHDKPHIVSTAHYLARVYPTRLAMLRGDFVEDKIGQRARDQMKEGEWVRWATWLYCPGEEKQLCLRHLHGRSWQGVEADLANKERVRVMLDEMQRDSAPKETTKEEPIWGYGVSDEESPDGED